MYMFGICKRVPDIYKDDLELGKEYYLQIYKDNCVKIKGNFYPTQLFNIVKVGVTCDYLV